MSDDKPEDVFKIEKDRTDKFLPFLFTLPMFVHYLNLSH